MKKLIIGVGLFILSTPAFADSNNSGIGIALPSTPNTYGQDSIRAGDLDCKNAIGGATQLEFGLTGVIDNAQGPFGGNSYDPYAPQTKDVGIYARIVIPLDKPKERINCNDLYELELRKKRLEVMRLQEELNALKRLNANGNSGFEN